MMIQKKRVKPCFFSGDCKFYKRQRFEMCLRCTVGSCRLSVVNGCARCRNVGKCRFDVKRGIVV